MWLSSVLVSSQIIWNINSILHVLEQVVIFVPKENHLQRLLVQMLCFAFLSWKQVNTETWELDLVSLVIIKLHNPVLLCLVMMISCFSPVLPARQIDGKAHHVCACLFILCFHHSWAWLSNGHGEHRANTCATELPGEILHTSTHPT